MFSFLGAALFALIWGLTIFVVLPFGVRSQAEDQNVAPGTDEAAPIAPKIGMKILATTGITCVIFGVLVILVDVLNYDLLRIIVGR